MLVQAQILPWFSANIIPGHHSPLLLEEELPPGARLRTLLTTLAGRYVSFPDSIYSPSIDMLQPAVVVVHNGRLVSPAQALDQALQAGDTVVLIPAYPGG